MKTRLAHLASAALLVLACQGWAVTPVTPKANTPPVAKAAQEKAHDYCRYIGNDVRGKLETAVVTMQNAKGVTVDLVGAVHIADAAYYTELNTLFETYDALLFELVDGQNLKAEFEGTAETPKTKKKGSNAKLTPKPETGAQAPKNAQKPEEDAGQTAEEKRETKTPKIQRANDNIAMSLIRVMMTSLGTYFRLEYQTEGIDYQAKNFVHADVSMAEFERLQEEKGESWAVLFQKSIEAQLKRKHRPEEEPKGSHLLLALLGDSSGIKITMAKMLGQLEGTAEEIGFGADSVIIGERNRVALEIFDREVKGGRKHMGIFYGAAHLSDMERRLEARGYQRKAERWLTAWDIKPRVEEKK